MNTLALADLDQIYRPPGKLVIDKSLTQVDSHGRSFIALSPFCVISSAGPDGAMDVSPRGGTPGFVHVGEDGGMLYLPDRPGNNRLDTIRNLLAGSGKVGLMFMVPGFDDVYRVNGQASATDDAELLGQFVEFGKPPRLVLTITVEETFFHCPKAIIRGHLWEPEARINRSVLPSNAEIVMDQLDMGKPTLSEAQILELNKAYL